MGVIPHWRVLLWRALVWRVSLWRLSFWRDSSSARFSLARFHFGAFLFGALPLRRVSLWRVSQFCTNLRWSGICEPQFRADYLCACFLSAEKSCQPLFARVAYLFCAHVSFRSSVVSILRACFLSAKNCFLRQLASISFCVTYLFALMFPICEEVFSTPVGRVSRFAPMLIEYASMACSMRSTYVSLLRNSVLYARISFLRIFPLYVAANWRIDNTSSQKTRAERKQITYYAST